jgi:hypothetical protein
MIIYFFNQNHLLKNGNNAVEILPTTLVFLADLLGLFQVAAARKNAKEMPI